MHDDEDASDTREPHGDKPRRIHRIDVDEQVDVLEHAGGFDEGEPFVVASP
jgi:hypothetical protein